MKRFGYKLAGKKGSIMSLAATISTITPPNVSYIQMDSLVIMKIVKHVDSELYAGMSEVAGEACQGLLTGLVSVEKDDSRLEITNCFPTARAEPVLESDENAAQANQMYEELKQQEMLDMLRKFRNMNIDYELVGFYQAHPFGACFSQDLVDSMFDYQSNGPDGVVIIYDPVKTRQGQLCMRAYRLSVPALELCAKNDWSPDAVKAANLTYQTMFEELPIVIKSSHLVNVMMAELSLAPTRIADRFSTHLELGSRRSLEKSVRAMMANIDELNKSISAYGKYVNDKQRHDNMIYNLTQKRQAENEQRIARGEPPLSMDDIRKQKEPQLQTRNGMLDAMLSSCETQALADFCVKVTGENIAKLFLAEALADDKGTTKDRSQSLLNR
ncbi:Mov34/MPN/PAD-1 family protein [Ancylostoma duodenale]|uniref:Eukaryotic translation initiation factor 3 subunit H n=1 Tax=Ancylostoma duodenale TaxID=51022 RepID=A0A0C2GZJ6_9BILA|nr:Mov34/MPN/PAD-1 family protein [Ancylostoma duodenale]